MKNKDFAEFKKMESKDLTKKIAEARLELDKLIIQKNTGKLSDLKVISKKKREIARMATIVSQKMILARLESNHA